MVGTKGARQLVVETKGARQLVVETKGARQPVAGLSHSDHYMHLGGGDAVVARPLDLQPTVGPLVDRGAPITRGVTTLCLLIRLAVPWAAARRAREVVLRSGVVG